MYWKQTVERKVLWELVSTGGLWVANETRPDDFVLFQWGLLMMMMQVYRIYMVMNISLWDFNVFKRRGYTGSVMCIKAFEIYKQVKHKFVDKKKQFYT